MTDKSEEDYNIELASRQVEINEWAYEDKMETLFVFQILFMSTLFIIILFYLKDTGIFPSSFVWYVVFILVLIVGILIINRASFTARKRDRRFWNRRRFPEDQTKDSPVGRGDKSYLDYVDRIRAKYGRNDPCEACPTKK
jgi:hypothetical protein